MQMPPWGLMMVKPKRMPSMESTKILILQVARGGANPSQEGAPLDDYAARREFKKCN